MCIVTHVRQASLDSSTEPTHCRTAYFATTRPQPSTAVISAHGELDAANAQAFVDYALGHIANAPQLVLDLTGLQFFGTAGFSALHTLNVRCAAKNLEWVLVPSPMVTRLLRLCDPDYALPVCATVNAAVGQLQRKPPPLLQPVSNPR
jgi:anti-anti-sigma factor